jgi:hypothetical protein
MLFFCESEISSLETEGSVKLRVFEDHLFLSERKKGEDKYAVKSPTILYSSPNTRY